MLQSVNFLTKKYKDKIDPSFVVTEITEESLKTARVNAHLKKYSNIKGSDKFQVMVFNSNSTLFKAAAHLCTCEKCLQDYGPCHLFSSFELRTTQRRKIQLC